MKGTGECNYERIYIFEPSMVNKIRKTLLSRNSKNFKCIEFYKF